VLYTTNISRAGFFVIATSYFSQVFFTSPLPLYVPCVPMVRRSTRHAVAEDGSSTTDEDTMQKAMQRKAAMNLEFSGMRSKSSSFVSLSTPVISSKLNVVGIRLGKNANEVYRT
jgi:hypothetical protein